MNFKELGISNDLVNALSKMGINSPTPIQEEAIPLIINKKDIIAQSQTGTGKTFAFLLPMFENINPKDNNIQGLIITPTRELALQISQAAEKLNESKNINILAAYGGKDIKSQLNKLKRNIHLVIAKEPSEITIKSREITLDTIRQEVVETTDRHKKDALCKVLNEDNPFMAIIFCRTKRRVDALEEALSIDGYNCEKLHSDISQAKRERVMKSFRKADLQYLIATDVASRGLDITGITHIYNYDIPETSEDYIHRIGRTGRAGKDGYTCMFVDPKNARTLEQIESDIKYRIPRRNIEE